MQGTQSTPGHVRISHPSIDAHHHLWRYDAERFAWIDDGMALLRRDFTPNDLLEVMRATGIQAAIAVQAQQNIEETRWLLDCAETNPQLCGVVGWLPLTDAGLPEVLDSLSHRERFVGAREIVQAEPAGFLDGEGFNRGIRRLTQHNLTYDILIRRDQLSEAVRFVGRHGNQRFVLDHIAKPAISSGELEPWRSQLLELGRHENVWCKLSGLVTEADWNSWTLDDLRPYLDTAVEAFGTRRLLAGSDWPVCLLASTYIDWWQQLHIYLSDFSEDEKDRIFGGNAATFYQVRLNNISSSGVSRADSSNG